MQREFGEAAGEANTIINRDRREEADMYAGKATRRRMHDKEKIVGKNEVMNKHNMPATVITVSLRIVNPVRMGFGEWMRMWDANT